MAVTAFASGTQTTILTTEHQLADVNVAGTYSFHIDTNVMVANDVIELRIYQMVLTGGTARVAYLARYCDAQPADDLIKISVPIGNELTDSTALRFSLKQTLGTVHAYPWKVLSY